MQARRISVTAAAAWLLAATLAQEPVRAGEADGFLYGKVTTERGTEYRGFLRWGKEEAAWGDFFNSTKEDRGVPSRLVRRNRRRETIRIFGIPVGVRSTSGSVNRTFKTRYGDIRTIQNRGGDRARVTMKSGAILEIDGGSNDLSATIRIEDRSVGNVEVEWDRVDTVEFMDVPEGAQREVFRLHGTVQTREGEFRGFIQWDQDECLSTDELDGETRDADLSLPMGNIRSIERESRRSARVQMKDGREFVLDGSNDVNDDNRGIYVEDARFGRVLVLWDAFERVDFSDAGSSGPAYSDFRPRGPLRGEVETIGGRLHQGQLIFDLDESEGWEFLDGNRGDVEYSILFGLVREITPRDSDSSEVVLRDGIKLKLRGATDVDEDNDGILVLTPEGDEIYVSWDDVDRIRFRG